MYGAIEVTGRKQRSVGRHDQRRNQTLVASPLVHVAPQGRQLVANLEAPQANRTIETPTATKFSHRRYGDSADPDRLPERNFLVKLSSRPEPCLGACERSVLSGSHSSRCGRFVQDLAQLDRRREFRIDRQNIVHDAERFGGVATSQRQTSLVDPFFGIDLRVGRHPTIPRRRLRQRGLVGLLIELPLEQCDQVRHFGTGWLECLRTPRRFQCSRGFRLVAKRASKPEIPRIGALPRLIGQTCVGDRCTHRLLKSIRHLGEIAKATIWILGQCAFDDLHDAIGKTHCTGVEWRW